MHRVILHIDMDAFFASVEQMDTPEWKGKPLVVGGEERGVVSAASYEARKFGIRSAMPIARAKQLCPHVITTRGRMDRYKEISQKVMSVLHLFSPVIEKASIDEAFLDATGTERLFGPPAALGMQIKQEMKSHTGLTCSVGIAPVKFLAKIASDQNKPNGLYIITEKDIPHFLQNLPVQKIPGVGKKFVEKLANLGVHTAKDVQNYPESFWTQKFGKSGTVLWQRSNGYDDRKIESFNTPKSESAENTLREDTLDRDLLKTWLLRQSERVGQNQRQMGIKGKTVMLKIKFADFQSITRSKSLPEPTDSTEIIYSVACSLLDALELPKKVRLIGVGLSNYQQGPLQLSLLPNENTCNTVASEKQKNIDKALDAVRNKFGAEAIVRGKLFRKT